MQFPNLLFFAFMMLFASTVQGQTLPGHDDNEEIACKEAHAKMRSFFMPNRSNPLTENYDLKYYRFEWQLDPAVYEIKGKATPYFKVLEDGFSEINFDFATVLNIDSIVYHGTKLEGIKSGTYGLKIILPAALSKNTLDSITIAYNGAPPSGGFGTFNTDKHGNVPIIWTLSEPFGSQDWWPCKNGLDDKIDSIDVHIITDSKYRAASNGLLVGEIPMPNDKIDYHWKHRYPITPYLVAFAVTNYTAYTDDVVLSDGRTMPMLNYVYPESLNTARKGTFDNVSVLQFYDSLFVDYPFRNEKYGHAQFPWGGGEEHQTMSFVVNFDWGLLAHELAHQWFGDYVTCGNWEDIWLNEGFATYLEGLTRERFKSAAEWYNWKLGKINSVLGSTTGSVKVDNVTSVNRIFSSRLSYNKGGMVLHALRWQLGDEAFFAGIKTYLKAHAYGYAVTDDLQEHLEQASGQNLDQFFADWFVGSGWPTYEVLWQQQNKNLYLSITQKSSDPSVDFFDIPVPITVKGKNGESKDLRIEVKQGELLSISEVDFEISGVQFDPTLWLISKSSVKNTMFVATDDEVNSQDILIYPIPTEDIINIKVNNQHLNELNAEIWTTYGQKVVQSSSSDGQSIALNTSELTNGFYILKVKSGNNLVLVKKILK